MAASPLESRLLLLANSFPAGSAAAPATAPAAPMFRRNERRRTTRLPVRLNFVIRYQRFLKSRQMKEFLISQILLLFFKTDERCSSSAHRKRPLG